MQWQATTGRENLGGFFVRRRCERERDGESQRRGGAGNNKVDADATAVQGSCPFFFFVLLVFVLMFPPLLLSMFCSLFSMLLLFPVGSVSLFFFCWVLLSVFFVAFYRFMLCW